MTTITIDIACNGEECGECDAVCLEFYCAVFRAELAHAPSISMPLKRCPACLAAERRAKGE